MASEILDGQTKTSKTAGLKPSQIRALAALFDSPSIVAAARKAEVGERTLQRWLGEDERFKTALRQAGSETLAQAWLRIQQNASRAVDAIHGLIASHRLP